MDYYQDRSSQSSQSTSSPILYPSSSSSISSSDDLLVLNLNSQHKNGKNIFDIPLICENININNERSIPGVRQRLVEHAETVQKNFNIKNDIPMLTPDEITEQYSAAFDKSLTIWDDQPKESEIEREFGPNASKFIHHNVNFFDTLGFNARQWTHAAPVTHTRSQRNFLQDYSHLRNPLRRYLLSQSVTSLNNAIVHFAQLGGMSCFQRCLPFPGRPITEDEKRCVHFCGESLADTRKIMVTDYLNLSEELDGPVLQTLPAGNEMGDKETGTFQGSNRYTQWNQYGREVGNPSANTTNQG